MKNINECILYRNFDQEETLESMFSILLACETKDPSLAELRELFYRCTGQLVEMSVSFGFAGNRWHNYLTFLLVNHENAFITACEIVGPVKGSINDFAKHDFTIFKELFDFDLTALDQAFGTSCCSLICDYTNVDENSKLFNKRIRDRICTLSRRLGQAEDVEEFMNDMVEFYKDFGVGKLGLHKAFRLEHLQTEANARIVPITKIAHVQLDDLVGYEIAKKKLLDKTETFIHHPLSRNKAPPIIFSLAQPAPGNPTASNSS